MRIAFLLLAGLVIVCCASAQQSLFQSGDGETALYLRDSSATFNLGDSKANAAHIHRLNIQKTFWGFGG